MEIWYSHIKNGVGKHFFKNGVLKMIVEYDLKGKKKKVIFKNLRGAKNVLG